MSTLKLVSITADVNHDGWRKKNVIFTVINDTGVLEHTPRDGSPNKLKCSCVFMGIPVELGLHVYTTIRNDSIVDDITIIIMDAGFNTIKLSNVRYQTVTTLRQTRLIPDTSSLDVLVGGPMGSDDWMFIIDEQHKVFVGNKDTEHNQYRYIGRLEEGAGTQSSAIVGTYPYTTDGGDAISLAWDTHYLKTTSETDRFVIARELRALISLLIEVVNVDCE